jgi:hypothetical protein
MILVSHNDASVVRNPGEGSFDYISSPVAIPESIVLSIHVPVVLSVRNQKADSPLFQAASSRIAIVGLVGDHPFGSCPGSSGSSFGDSDLSKSLIKERDLSRRGRVGMASERNTQAIDQYQALRSLSPLGFPDSRAPFLAGKKLPSTNTSSHSRMPSWSSSERKARHMSLSTSSSYHCLRRLQQVEGWGYWSGRSFHLAPVLRIQRIPSKQARSSAGGRPPLGLRGFGGISGLIFSHCSSVNIGSRTLIGAPPKSVLREKYASYKYFFSAISKT